MVRQPERQSFYGTPGGISTDYSRQPILSKRNPTADDTSYDIGQLWVNTAIGEFYGLSRVTSGKADWEILGSSSGSLSTLTGDTGGAISPTAGNINIVGSGKITTSGSGSTITLDTTLDGHAITPYVVGPTGGYSTIQAAINAASAAGGGTVYIQPGVYNENLTLVAAVHLVGVSASATGGIININGQHTPPTADSVCGFRNIFFANFSGGNIISSAAAGRCNLNFTACIFVILGGSYIFNLANWLGPAPASTQKYGLELFNCLDLSLSPGSATINNSAGGMSTLFRSSYIGSIDNPSTINNLISGETLISECDIFSPITITGGTDHCIEHTTFHDKSITVSGSTTGCITTSAFLNAGGAVPAFIYNSTGDWRFSNNDVASGAVDTIQGTGSGNLYIVSAFTFNDGIAASLAGIAAGTYRASAFVTTSSSDTLRITTNILSATNNSGPNSDVRIAAAGTGALKVITGSGIEVNSGTITNLQTSAGSTITVNSTNSDNTNAASHAELSATAGGSSGGDAKSTYSISGVKTYSLGIDNSDSDNFVISDGSSLGTNNRLTIDASNGNTSVLGNLALPTSGTGLQIEAGSVLDTVGVATLSSGTVTVANTNINANDIILISRQSAGSSSALGELTYTISAGVSFTITSIDVAAPPATEIGDNSVAAYMIVRRL